MGAGDVFPRIQNLFVPKILFLIVKFTKLHGLAKKKVTKKKRKVYTAIIYISGSNFSISNYLKRKSFFFQKTLQKEIKYYFQETKLN